MGDAVTKVLRWALLAFSVTLALVLGGAFVGDPPVAQAQRKAEAEKARKLMEEGQSLFKQGLYQEAMEKFEEAYKTHAFSAFLYNAALAAEKAGDLRRSIARYNEYLASDSESPYADQVKAKIEKLEEELSKVPEPGEGGAGGEGGDSGEGGAGGGEDKPKPAAPVARRRGVHRADPILGAHRERAQGRAHDHLRAHRAHRRALQPRWQEPRLAAHHQGREDPQGSVAEGGLLPRRHREVSGLQPERDRHQPRCPVTSTPSRRTSRKAPSSASCC